MLRKNCKYEGEIIMREVLEDGTVSAEIRMPVNIESIKHKVFMQMCLDLTREGGKAMQKLEMEDEGNG